uniref:Uncharacterized protein n=1 Tax=Arundo donax TaxID=35708 RepID=A0A0A9HMK1_ARUDO
MSHQCKLQERGICYGIIGKRKQHLILNVEKYLD